MTEKQRIQEQTFFEEAEKWLKENGDYKVYYLEDSQQYKVTFSNEKENIELVGDDSLLLSIQIYNEVNN
jgi:hypothetical protein